MIRPNDVINMLCQNVEYTCKGFDYEGINWLGKPAPITKAQYEKGFAQYEAWKTKQDADKASAKSALLAKLGITEDEAKLLLS
jgi:hypothetical protein